MNHILRTCTLAMLLGLPVLAHTEIIGEESGRTISNDPTEKEAQLAEVIGYGVFCKTHGTGSLSLIEHAGKHYLLGAAHGYYKDNGEVPCDTHAGMFFPDDHYVGTKGIDPKRGYAFKLPPLNADTVLRTEADYLYAEKMNDFVLLEITDLSVLTNQSGKPRAPLKLARTPSNRLPNLSQNSDVILISGRDNYHNYLQVSIEQGCSIRAVNSDTPVMRHNCDTGQGPSGASLIVQENGQIYSLGVHYAGNKSTIQGFETHIARGTFFIPSNHILNTLESLTGPDFYNPPFYAANASITQPIMDKSATCVRQSIKCLMSTYAMSDFLRAQTAASPDDLARAETILRQSANDGFGPALMDLAVLTEFTSIDTFTPHAAQWPRSPTYYQHLFRLKPRFPTDANAAAAAHISALQSQDSTLLARAKTSWGPSTARALQARLAELDHYSGPIDGDIGAGTKQAMRLLCDCDAP